MIVLIYCEQQFKRMESFAEIVQVLVTIEAGQIEQQPIQRWKAAGGTHREPLGKFQRAY